MAANGMGSALLVPAFRLHALPHEAALAPASQQDARVSLARIRGRLRHLHGSDCKLAGITDVSEEEAQLLVQVSLPSAYPQDCG